jgi:hypothetical protein
MSKDIDISDHGSVMPGTPMAQIVAHLPRLGIPDDAGRYMLEAHRHFEDLKLVASQLAGILLVVESCSGGSVAGHPMLARAEELFQECQDGIRRLKPGASSQHHHHHLTEAATLIATTLATLASSRLADSTKALASLKAGWQQLIHASHALPGFEAIDLSQSCCADHMKLRKAAIFNREGETR